MRLILVVMSFIVLFSCDLIQRKNPDSPKPQKPSVTVQKGSKYFKTTIEIRKDPRKLSDFVSNITRRFGGRFSAPVSREFVDINRYYIAFDKDLSIDGMYIEPVVLKVLKALNLEIHKKDGREPVILVFGKNSDAPTDTAAISIKLGTSSVQGPRTYGRDTDFAYFDHQFPTGDRLRVMMRVANEKVERFMRQSQSFRTGHKRHIKDDTIFPNLGYTNYLAGIYQNNTEISKQGPLMEKAHYHSGCQVISSRENPKINMKEWRYILYVCKSELKRSVIAGKPFVSFKRSDYNKSLPFSEKHPCQPYSPYSTFIVSQGKYLQCYGKLKRKKGDEVVVLGRQRSGYKPEASKDKIPQKCQFSREIINRRCAKKCEELDGQISTKVVDKKLEFYISSSYKSGVFHSAGLRKGDQILAYGRKKSLKSPRDIYDLKNLIFQMKAFSLTIKRGEKIKRLKCTYGK